MTYYATAVCNTLNDGYATINGLIGIGEAIIEDGYSPKDAGTIMADSVIGTCPQYIPLLQRFVDRYAGANSKALA